MTSMKAILAGLTLTAALAGSAGAQSAADLWHGAYGGLSFHYVNPNSDTPVDPDQGTAVGLFAGYNHALDNNWVVGGEIAFTGRSEHAVPGDTFGIENTISARLRAGYAFDNVLVYGLVGYSSSNGNLSSLPIDLVMDGPVFGIGGEMMLSENVSARLEYTRGDLTLQAPGGDIGVTTDNISLGVAFHF